MVVLESARRESGVRACGAGGAADGRRGHEHGRLAARGARERLRALGLKSQGRAVRFEVRAPRDGVVLTRDVDVGAPVTPASVVATMAATDEVWFLAHVFERDVARVAPGSEASWSAAPSTGSARAGSSAAVDEDGCGSGTCGARWRISSGSNDPRSPGAEEPECRRQARPRGPRKRSHAHPIRGTSEGFHWTGSGGRPRAA